MPVLAGLTEVGIGAPENNAGRRLMGINEEREGGFVDVEVPEQSYVLKLRLER
jgi:hypothetical protein